MALNSYKYFLLSLCIRKFRIIRQPDQIDGSDRAVSLFGDDDFRDSLILGILIIVIISIDKHNNISAKRSSHSAKMTLAPGAR